MQNTDLSPPLSYANMTSGSADALNRWRKHHVSASNEERKRNVLRRCLFLLDRVGRYKWNERKKRSSLFFINICKMNNCNLHIYMIHHSLYFHLIDNDEMMKISFKSKNIRVQDLQSHLHAQSSLHSHDPPWHPAPHPHWPARRIQSFIIMWKIFTHLNNGRLWAFWLVIDNRKKIEWRNAGRIESIYTSNNRSPLWIFRGCKSLHRHVPPLGFLDMHHAPPISRGVFVIAHTPCSLSFNVF